MKVKEYYNGRGGYITIKSPDNQTEEEKEKIMKEIREAAKDVVRAYMRAGIDL